VTGTSGAADRSWSGLQRVGAGVVVAGPVAVALLSHTSVLDLWGAMATVCFAVVVALKVLSVLVGFVGRHVIEVPGPAVAAAGALPLPRYTVLVPLYREPLVVESLLTALAALDYPAERLEVLLLLEADDTATHAAALAQSALMTRASARVVVVPAGLPRTKPRACNHGLELARGELVVVYDAEDRPEPDQLKKAVVAFRQLGPGTVCLQAKLNYDNWRHNILSRLFTLEYTAWFDLYLPGLHALGLPIPLGGTSNHFRTAALRALGGWDAHNVTEDCELGIRLARERHATWILDSTTWEEACSAPGPWLRQRSRWVKGYLQTFFVHTRDLRGLVRDLGLWRTVGMILTVGGLAGSLVLAVPALGLFGLALVCGLPWHADPLLWILLGFAAAFTLAHIYAVQQRGRWQLMAYGLLLPLYWLLMGVAALRGFLHFFSRPFYWDKTPHGLSTAALGSAPSRPPGPVADPRAVGIRRTGTSGRVAKLAVSLGISAAVIAMPIILFRC
jgi:cellulose synthase/poly-beta-1,6-N-acetylglucosamine synthase-like glycosyltransferase